MQTKVCTKCGQEKPATEEFFYKHDEGKYGLCPVCKPCHYKRSREYKKRNPEKHAAWLSRYRVEYKDVLRERNRAYYEKNKDRILQRCREYTKENWGRYLENQRRWRKENGDRVNVLTRNRRARLRGNGGKHSLLDIHRLLAEQNNECAYCGEHIGHSYQVDHITPISKGGWNDPSNLQLLCKRCNLSKRDMMPLEYFIKLAAIEKGEIRG